MKVIGNTLFVLVVVALIGWGLVATSAETTTLDDAVEHPVKVEKYVDKDNNVVCYWIGRHPVRLSCVQIEQGWSKAK